MNLRKTREIRIRGSSVTKARKGTRRGEMCGFCQAGKPDVKGRDSESGFILRGVFVPFSRLAVFHDHKTSTFCFTVRAGHRLPSTHLSTSGDVRIAVDAPRSDGRKSPGSTSLVKKGCVKTDTLASKMRRAFHEECTRWS